MNLLNIVETSIGQETGQHHPTQTLWTYCSATHTLVQHMKSDKNHLCRSTVGVALESFLYTVCINILLTSTGVQRQPFLILCYG